MAATSNTFGNQPMRKLQHGVSLIELIIVLLIVSILASVAYPSYRSYTRRAHRTEAKTALLQLQVAQEKYFLQNNAYAPTLNTDNLGLGYTSQTPETSNGYYTLNYTVGNPATTYTVTATANAKQNGDTNCIQFAINQTGARSSYDSSGVATTGCW